MVRLSKLITKSPVVKLLVVFLKRLYFTKKRVNLYIFLVIFQKEVMRDSLIERSRSMAFSFMLSIFPAILFTFTLVPYIPIEDLSDKVMTSLSEVLPLSIYASASETVLEIINIPSGGLMSFGFLFAMYSATNGIMAMIEAFNRCYSSSDRRSFARKFLISVLIILLLTIIIVTAIGITIILEMYIHYLPGDKQLEVFLLGLAKYTVIFFIFYIGISMIYFLAPAVQKRWNFFSHGSFIATIMVIGFTMLFSYYVDNFNSYNKIYGSIGALIGLMLWFNFISLMLLFGFEINACIEIAQKDYYKEKLLN